MRRSHVKHEHPIPPSLDFAGDREYQLLLQSRIRQLEAALARYCNCRHACIDCFCTLEARAAMFASEAS